MEPIKKSIKQYRNVWTAVYFHVNPKISSIVSTRKFEEGDSAEMWATLLTAIGLHYLKRE